MATIGKTRRGFVKDRMEKIAAGGTIETDVEQMQAKRAQAEMLGAGAAAQQQVLNQAAAANQAGAPVMAGALQKAAGGITQKTQDAAVKAAGEAARHRAAVRAQREGETLAASERLIAQNRQDLATAVQAVGMATDWTGENIRKAAGNKAAAIVK